LAIDRHDFTAGVVCRTDSDTVLALPKPEELLGIALPPDCLVVVRGPGHHLKVPVQGGLKEPAIAHLLNLEEATAEVQETPALGVVVLLRARDHAEFEAGDFVRVEKSAVADLLNRVNVATHPGQPPVLGVVVLKWPGDHIEVTLRDLVRVEKSQPIALQSDEPRTGRDTLLGGRC